jgi:hypothetical protein
VVVAQTFGWTKSAYVAAKGGAFAHGVNGNT